MGHSVYMDHMVTEYDVYACVVHFIFVRLFIILPFRAEENFKPNDMHGNVVYVTDRCQVQMA